jgi:hypothetical protein
LVRSPLSFSIYLSLSLHFLFSFSLSLSISQGPSSTESKSFRSFHWRMLFHSSLARVCRICKGDLEW